MRQGRAARRSPVTGADESVNVEVGHNPGGTLYCNAVTYHLPNDAVFPILIWETVGILEGKLSAYDRIDEYKNLYFARATRKGVLLSPC